jgi:putative DNA methylase
MSADAAELLPAASGLSPLSLKDAPSFIEVQFPVGRLSAEAYKERKAVGGQTLTALGSYWKGRKPLILCRAVVLGCLLPATGNPAKDLDIFLKLMGMDDAAFLRRGLIPRPSEIVGRLMPTGEITSIDAARLFVIKRRTLEGNKAVWVEEQFDLDAFEELVEDRQSYLDWSAEIGDGERDGWRLRALETYTYDERVKRAKRPEECCEETLLDGIWDQVDAHLGTRAQSLPELVQQLGMARFGHRPKLADTFCGAGSIPFEAARIGCDVFASDLNPIACMLSWGAFNIIGDTAERAAITKEYNHIADKVEAELTRLAIESDEQGNRGKVYLYCLETRCPKTGWMVPMLPSFIISDARKVIARLVPNEMLKRYEIEIVSGVSLAEMAEAAKGTIRQGRLVHPMNPERSGVEIQTIRGYHRGSNGEGSNRLRLWEKSDFSPQADDLFQERLYCIQWITKDTIEKSRHKTFFAAVTESDLQRERRVHQIVEEHVVRWQENGQVSDAPIISGKENEGPIRTNGWSYWHQLFMPRAILTAALISAQRESASLLLSFSKYLDNNSKSCRWAVSQSGGDGGAKSTFDSQALKTIFNWAFRSLRVTPWNLDVNDRKGIVGRYNLRCLPAHEWAEDTDLFVTDPPYADSIRYEEITEFFIAWLRKNPPVPFDQWTWDSQRDLAIKGKDEDFRRAMVAAYAAMTRHMPDNGLQVVMFTHQDAGVWADLGAILWAAGLRVTAAWNIVTEAESALKEGNYVQGTVCLVLRKRLREANARRMEIEAEIEDAVRAQLDRLLALDAAWRTETLYTDGDLTLAAYAAALQVVTSYSSIDRQPLDRDLYRKLGKGERTMIRDLVEYAAQVANGMLVPEGFPRDAWRDLDAPSRFYVRMLDMEAKGSPKVADFQNFAKSFAFAAYADLMASTVANAASLAGAADLKGRMLDGDGFAKTALRQVLFAIWKTLEKGDPKTGVMVLHAEYVADYWARRQKLIGLAAYVAAKTARTRPEESAAAHELAEALKLDKV